MSEVLSITAAASALPIPDGNFVILNVKWRDASEMQSLTLTDALSLDEAKEFARTKNDQIEGHLRAKGGFCGWIRIDGLAINMEAVAAIGAEVIVPHCCDPKE